MLDSPLSAFVSIAAKAGVPHVAAPPRVAFVRTMTPLHDLGGGDVVIIYALGDTQKLDTFVDTFLDRTNRSEALRISAEVNHMRRAAGEHPDPLMIRRIDRARCGRPRRRSRDAPHRGGPPRRRPGDVAAGLAALPVIRPPPLQRRRDFRSDGRSGSGARTLPCRHAPRTEGTSLSDGSEDVRAEGGKGTVVAGARCPVPGGLARAAASASECRRQNAEGRTVLARSPSPS